MTIVQAGGTYFDLDEVLYATDRGLAKRGEPDGALLIRFRSGYILSLVGQEMAEAVAHLASLAGESGRGRPPVDGA